MNLSPPAKPPKEENNLTYSMFKDYCTHKSRFDGLPFERDVAFTKASESVSYRIVRGQYVYVLNDNTAKYLSTMFKVCNINK